MKLLTKEKALKLVFESGLIIFSVMLALFLDEYRSNLKEQAATQKALTNIEMEMTTNLEVLKRWQKYHEQVYVNIDGALKSEEMDSSKFIRDGMLHYYSVMPNGVVQELIDDSAWQAFRSTQRFSNLEFETILSLSKVYKLQQSGVQNTLEQILMNFSDSDFFEQSKLKQNLIVLKRAFGEIASQEEYLIFEYQKALKHLKETQVQT